MFENIGIIIKYSEANRLGDNCHQTNGGYSHRSQEKGLQHCGGPYKGAPGWSGDRGRGKHCV